MNEKMKLLIKIIIGLIIVQGVRIVLKQIVFSFVDEGTRSMPIDRVISALIMTVMTIIGIITAKKKGISLSVFPTDHKMIYIITTVIASALFISTPFITGDKSLFTIFTLVYSVIITPIFEELIFRGYLWNKLEERFENKIFVYIITTLLFALWHLGYIDSIAFIVPSESLLFIMFMKVVTGFCFGIVLGAARHKTKNCYSTIIAHGVMNLFGR